MSVDGKTQEVGQQSKNNQAQRSHQILWHTQQFLPLQPNRPAQQTDQLVTVVSHVSWAYHPKSDEVSTYPKPPLK